MKVDRNMSIYDLAERMGDSATEAEALAMRDLLVDLHEGKDTSDIPEAEWLRLLEQAEK